LELGFNLVSGYRHLSSQPCRRVLEKFTKSQVETNGGKMETEKLDGPGPAILGGEDDE